MQKTALNNNENLCLYRNHTFVKSEVNLRLLPVSLVLEIFNLLKFHAEFCIDPLKNSFLPYIMKLVPTSKRRFYLLWLMMFLRLKLPSMMPYNFLLKEIESVMKSRKKLPKEDKTSDWLLMMSLLLIWVSVKTSLELLKWNKLLNKMLKEENSLSKRMKKKRRLLLLELKVKPKLLSLSLMLKRSMVMVSE